MALAAIVTNIDDVPETVREHYIEKDGKWHLHTEGDEAKVRLNRDIQSERKKRQETEAQLAKLNTELQELRVRRARADDDDETTTARVKRAQAELEEERRTKETALRELQAENTKITSQNMQLRIGNMIRTVGQGKLHPYALEDAVLYGMQTWRDDGTGKFVAFDSAGERMLSKSGDDLSGEEWIEDLRKSKPHWYAQPGTGNQGGGAPHQGGGQAQSRARPKKRSEMSAAEKADAIGDLGIAGFMAIPE